jgi:alkylation response protein AidB-like acyl-CoA dehydrogenase
MHLPGIEVRTITEITGGHHFCEVFFTDVRIPADNLVGQLNDGWRLAKVTLGNERVSLSTGGVLWGNGPTGLDLIDALRSRSPMADAHLRQQAARVYTEHVLLDLIRMRTLAATLKGQEPGPEASIRKLLADEHGQHVMSLARSVIGADALLTAVEHDGYHPERDGRVLTEQGAADPLEHPSWYHGYMFSQALTIGGGTWAVQRNILAERVLGLPHDVDVTKGLSWAEAQRTAGGVRG